MAGDKGGTILCTVYIDELVDSGFASVFCKHQTSEQKRHSFACYNAVAGGIGVSPVAS